MKVLRKLPSKNTLIAVLSFCAINTLVLPLAPYFFGKSYTESFLQHFVFYITLLIIVPALWFVGIKVLNLDAKGPVSWYSSPLVWFTPIFIVVLYFMFAGQNV